MVSRNTTISRFEGLALTNENPSSPFINIQHICNQINRRQQEIEDEDTRQTNYLSFKNISPAEFAAIDEHRDYVLSRHRNAHCEDTNGSL